MAELRSVRRFPAEDKQVESGPIMFGDDWPGLFLRGKDCHLYRSALRDLLLDKADVGLIIKRVLEGLLDDLDSADARVNDAYPTWHKESEPQ